MIRSRGIASLVVLSGVLLCGASWAAETADAQPYSGDFLSRSTLTGDWFGVRNDLAAKGITFDASVTQVEQGVVDGGTNSSWEYGGRGDLVAHLDTGKLGLWPGGFLTAELEGNWSDAVNARTGAIMPVNNNDILPLPNYDNAALDALNFTQFLSHYVGVTLGKYATITANSGDMNEFAHGKGDTQFMNLAFNFNPVLAPTVPYSTLGAGVIGLPTKDPNQAVVSFLVLQANGTASTSGFEKLYADKLSFAGEGRVRTGFFDLTGHQLLGASYSNRQYTQLDQRLGSVLRDRGLAKKDGSWNVYYNFDQFLYEPKKGSGRGAGVFARFGASDGNPNPMEFFYSAGLGGKGIIPSRERDQCGIGYYYIDVVSPTFQGPRNSRSFLQSEWGFEAYYNVAVTPWILLTPDLQLVGGAQRQKLTTGEHVGDAVVLGLRGQLIF
jgi:porin